MSDDYKPQNTEGHDHAGHSVMIHARTSLRYAKVELAKSSGDPELDTLFLQIVQDAFDREDDKPSTVERCIDLMDVAMELPVGEEAIQCRLLARVSSFDHVDIVAFRQTRGFLRWQDIDYCTLHRAMDNYFLEATATRRIECNDTYSLTPRMIECLQWTAVGKTSEEIAIILDLSAHTVNNYLTMATQKLNAVNRAQAVARAISLGIISMT